MQPKRLRASAAGWSPGSDDGRPERKNMKNIIKVNADSEMYWEIESTEKLTEKDIEFIENYYPVTFLNDVTCEYWAFDKELPSGRYLENISMKEYRVFTAYIH